MEITCKSCSEISSMCETCDILNENCVYSIPCKSCHSTSRECDTCENLREINRLEEKLRQRKYPSIGLVLQIGVLGYITRTIIQRVIR